MLCDRIIPTSWRERDAMRHLQGGDPKSDASFPAGVGRETLDSLQARGWATKRPDLTHGGFIFTITREGEFAVAEFAREPRIQDWSAESRSIQIA